MSSSRRAFLQQSATAAAAIGLNPLGGAAAAALAVEPGPTTPAAIKAFEEKMLRARPLALQAVRLTGGPLKATQDATVKYLLALEPDRMMAYYRVQAGLPKKAEPYGGWDGGGRNLTGHIAGHYLSAVSLMYRATGDERFKARADQLVAEMKVVQDKNGDGYLGALENGRAAFAALSKGEIRSAAFDLNGLWSPWYTLHKTYAGLRDAYRLTGNRGALDVEIKFAAWAEKVLAPLNETQVQRMLNTEHGGMNEILADLYADTGNTRWLDLSYRFEHTAFTDPLKRAQDNLSGKHGNCQIPKLIGSAQRFGYTGDTSDILAASFFFDRVAQRHSYATGGHGLAEYFGAPDQLSTRVDGRTCESCNVYNMLKLAKRLFALRPDALYADFHERALFNHALASCDPNDYHTSYMVPVGRAVQQEYQDMQRSFTCCVGTGMENPALYGYGIYYESADTLWVNLFAPSTAQFTTGGVKMTMETGFPDGDSAKIALAMPKSKQFTVAIRRPYWAGDGFAVKVNGTPVEQPPFSMLHDAAAGGRGNAPGNEATYPTSTYVMLDRAWSSGDTIELAIPKSVRLEPTPDNRSVAAVMWGPLVLAGDLGPRREREGRGGGPGGGGAAPTAAPALVAAERPVEQWVVPDGSRTGDFVARQVGRVPSAPGGPTDVALTPFYRTHQRTYSVYFDVLTPAEFDAKVASIAAERERVRRLEAASVAFVQPGNETQERERGYRSEPAERPVQRQEGRSGRGGPGWFSYDLPTAGSADLALVVTYFNEVGMPATMGNFEIQVDGTTIASFAPNASAAGLYDATYAIPATVGRDKPSMTVRFQAAPNGRIAGVFGVRVVRAKEL